MSIIDSNVYLYTYLYIFKQTNKSQYGYKRTLNLSISTLFHYINAHRPGGVDDLRNNALKRNTLQVGVGLLDLGNFVDLLQSDLAHHLVTRLVTNSNKATKHTSYAHFSTPAQRLINQEVWGDLVSKWYELSE